MRISLCVSVINRKVGEGDRQLQARWKVDYNNIHCMHGAKCSQGKLLRLMVVVVVVVVGRGRLALVSMF